MTHNETRISNERLAEKLAELDDYAGNYTAPQSIREQRAMILELQALRTPVEAEPVAWRWTYSIEEGGRMMGPFYGERAPDLSDWPNAVVTPLYAHPLPNPSPSDGEVIEALTVPARDGLEAQRGLNDIFPGDPYPVHDQLKRGLDNLRAEASRGAVSSRQIFTMTDPLMDILSRSSRAIQSSKRGQP